MVNYGDIQFVKRMMVSRRSEMSAEWKVMFAICIASVAIQAFTGRNRKTDLSFFFQIKIFKVMRFLK
jgi:hypothetical protein